MTSRSSIGPKHYYCGILCLSVCMSALFSVCAVRELDLSLNQVKIASKYTSWQNEKLFKLLEKAKS